MNFTDSLKVLFAAMLFLFSLGCFLAAPPVEVKSNLDQVSWLHDNFKNISYARQGALVVSKFDAKEVDFLEFLRSKNYKPSEIEESVLVPTFDFKKLDKLELGEDVYYIDVYNGWFYVKSYDGGGSLLIVYDSNKKVGYYVSFPN